LGFWAQLFSGFADKRLGIQVDPNKDPQLLIRGETLKGRNFKKLILLFVMLLSPLAGCGGTPPQVSGIVALTTIETIACAPRKKTLKIRNTNASEPQRVQGVLFEMGTNEDKYFKINDVTVNGTVKKAVANLAEEIILPPGGTMAITVTYNPKAVTTGEEYHVTYLDLVLNGPKLGVMQIEIRGTAPTALEGCSPDLANATTFEVVSVTTVLDDVDLPDNPVEAPLDLNTQVEGDFKFIIDGDSVMLPAEGWPMITLKPPDTQDIPVTLSEDSPEGTFVNGVLTIEGMTLLASGIPLPNVTLTTGTALAEAADIEGGTLSRTGQAFDEATGEMTLVIALPLVNPAFSSYSISDGGFAAVIVLREKKTSP
jgi:hypothetical protein